MTVRISGEGIGLEAGVGATDDGATCWGGSGAGAGIGVSVGRTLTTGCAGAGGSAVTTGAGRGRKVVWGTGGSGDALTLGQSELVINSAATLTAGRAHVCMTAAANYTVTLPTAASASGRLLSIRIDAANTRLVTVKGNGTENIDGQNTRIMWSGETATLYSNGTYWMKVSGKSIPMSAYIFVNGSSFVYSNTWSKIGRASCRERVSSPV